MRARSSSSSAWMRLLERRDLRDQRVGIAALPARPADLLGQRVAPRLALLQLGLQRADRRVVLAQLRRRRRQPAARQRPIERVGVLTQPFQVEHVRSHAQMASASGK